MYTPIVKSFFSGCGGLDKGMELGGCNVIESLEIDKAACDSLRLNFNHTINQADITKETVMDKSDCDVMAFTFPCTKYSTIADIHGTRTGDELFYSAFRFAALYQPECYVIENVVGLRRFKIVVEAFTKLAPYHVQVFCPLNASNWLPQKRERLIIIATKKRFFISEPAPSVHRPTLRDIMEKDIRWELPQYAIDRLNGKYRDKPILSDPSNKHALAPCAISHYAKDFSTRMLVDPGANSFGVRPYTVREYARLQGFPDDFRFGGSERDAYRQIGNAVPVPMGRWIGENLVKYFNQSSGILAA